MVYLGESNPRNDITPDLVLEGIKIDGNKASLFDLLSYS